MIDNKDFAQAEGIEPDEKQPTTIEQLEQHRRQLREEEF